MIIGIEVELHSDNYSADYIAEKEGLNFDSFTTLKGMSMGVKLSREYYSSTIEYNFTPFENNIKNFCEVKCFLEGQIEKYGLKKHSCGPSYVGTHIHIFDDDRINMRISNLLKGVAGFLMDNISHIERDGVQRLLFAHQLWGNFSWENNHIWRDFLRDKRRGPDIYNNTKDKPKYKPIINSLANSQTGKPRSLEIRLIPNEFMFGEIKAFELMELIENKKINKNKKEVMDLYNLLYDTLYPKSNNSENLHPTCDVTLEGDMDYPYEFNNRNYYKGDIVEMLSYFIATGSTKSIIEIEGINGDNYTEFINLLLDVQGHIIYAGEKDVIARLISDIDRVFSEDIPF